ncbi:MAG: hypothetical protein WCD34_08025, partial [Candidatus Acidiferrum sp.]
LLPVHVLQFQMGRPQVSISNLAHLQQPLQGDLRRGVSYTLNWRRVDTSPKGSLNYSLFGQNSSCPPVPR